MNEQQAIVFNIQRFCTHDGPGIRTTIFFKGCNNHCLWCHNPESLSPTPQMRIQRSGCTLCGACAAVCKRGAHRVGAGEHGFLPALCDACGACLAACPYGAMEMVGQAMGLEAVVDAALRDGAFYAQSGGGVTLSGGEPLLQSGFVFALLERLRDAGIHTAIETAGNLPTDTLIEAAARCDLLLFDYKSDDAEVLRRYTGIDREWLHQNLLAVSGKTDIILRTPVMQGVNDSPEALLAIARVAERVEGLLYWELLRYHALAQGKYAGLGMIHRADFETPQAEALECICRMEGMPNIPIRLDGDIVKEGK